MIPNLTVVSVDQAFIATLASLLERSINWSATITESTLYLTVGTANHESAIQVKAGTL